MEINKRIQEIREANKMTITAFATVLGEKRQRIQDVELGRQKAPQEVLTRIVEKLHINANWLLTGQGEMYKGSEKQDMKIVKMAELMEDWMPHNGKRFCLLLRKNNS